MPEEPAPVLMAQHAAQTRAPQERILRGVDPQRPGPGQERREARSGQGSRSEDRGHDPRPLHVAPGHTLGAPNQRQQCRQSEDQRRQREELGMGQRARGQQQPRRDRRSGRPDREKGSGREEQPRLEQIGEVAVGEMHGERPGQSPRGDVPEPPIARSDGIARTQGNEGRCREPDGDGAGHSGRRERLHGARPRGPAQDERQRGDAGPGAHGREPVVGGEPRPPEVDGSVRSHAEVPASPRVELGEEHQEGHREQAQQDPVEPSGSGPAGRWRGRAAGGTPRRDHAHMLGTIERYREATTSCGPSSAIDTLAKARA